MRLSLKAKLTGLVTGLVLVVVVVISAVYISNLTRQALREVQSKGEYVASEVYHQASTILAQSRMPAGSHPDDFDALRRFVQERLSSDAGLASLMESAVGYSPTLYYVTITDTALVILVHNDPGKVGYPLLPAPRYTQLLQAGPLQQLRVVYGPPRVYEVILPLAIGDRALGDVRVGVSTLFLRNQVTPELRAALILSLLAI